MTDPGYRHMPGVGQFEGRLPGWAARPGAAVELLQLNLPAGSPRCLNPQPLDTRRLAQQGCVADRRTHDLQGSACRPPKAQVGVDLLWWRSLSRCCRRKPAARSASSPLATQADLCRNGLLPCVCGSGMQRSDRSPFQLRACVPIASASLRHLTPISAAALAVLADRPGIGVPLMTRW